MLVRDPMARIRPPLARARGKAARGRRLDRHNQGTVLQLCEFLCKARAFERLESTVGSGEGRDFGRIRGSGQQQAAPALSRCAAPADDLLGGCPGLAWHTWRHRAVTFSRGLAPSGAAETSARLGDGASGAGADQRSAANSFAGSTLFKLLREPTVGTGTVLAGVTTRIQFKHTQGYIK